MEEHRVGPELLTVREVAERLRVRPTTIYAAAKRQVIPHVRLWQSRSRALIRFRAEDIEKLIHERTTGRHPACPSAETH